MIQRKKIQKRIESLIGAHAGGRSPSVPSFAKRTSSVLISAAVAAMMSVTNVNALGLGNLEVQSNLEQPLNGFIDLRVFEGEDLSGLNAQIASEEDFESLGIDYPNYLSDINLSVDTQGSQSILRVSSGDVVISEPFIHFLVRVDWSGGSFLREYTALIDPPSYAAETPRSISAPTVVGTDESYQAEPAPEFGVEDLDQVDEFDQIEEIEEVYDVEPEDVAAVEIEQEFEESTEQAYDETVDSYQESADTSIADIVDQGLSEPADTSSYNTGTLPTDAQYGPVTSGESLSVIAAELQQQFPDLSIYQIMKVLFEENRAAFINQNINGLIKGAILNIGDLNAIRAVDIAEGKEFFRQQLSEWDPSYLESSVSEDDSISVGSDEYSFDDEFGSDSGSNNDLLNDSQDSFQVGASSSQDSFVSSAEGGSDSGEVLLLQQQIVELETSLGSSQLENQELTERISILEGQLADMNRLMELSVENADLANVEATLAEQNAASEYDLIGEANDTLDAELDGFEAEFNADEVVDEVSDELEGTVADLDEGLDDALYDDLADIEDADRSLEEGVEEFGEVVDSGIDEIEEISDNVDSELAIDEIEEVTDAAIPTVASAPATNSQSVGFMGKAKQAIADTGMVGIGAGLGGLILAVLGLLIYRRRKADEEFEISMLSIGSESQTIDDLATKSVSQIDARTAAEGGGDRDTSFLTVYTDTDAVVQADEVDPVAEADVYIAYGRDEQAEEVLLDGISNYPARVDIKHKLLTLYHKNTNVEGFERVAEEAYAQRADLSTDAWEDISRMGKSISPDNPIFELSSEELAAANKAVNQIEDDNDFGEEEAGAAAAAAAAATAAALAANSESTFGDEAEEPLAALLDDDDSIDAGKMSDQMADDELAEIEKAVAAAEVSVAAVSESDDTEQAPTPAKADEFELLIPSDDADDDAALALADDTPEPEDDLPFAEESPSINLINFDDGRSEMSELDEVSIDSLSRADEATVHDERTQTVLQEGAGDANIDSPTVSGLELDPDYDEARTQYELAKVFVDLGDEDGARKILTEILANDDNADQLIRDSQDLLDSIKA